MTVRKDTTKSQYQCGCGRTLRQTKDGTLLCVWKCGYFVLPGDIKRLVKQGKIKELP